MKEFRVMYRLKNAPSGADFDVKKIEAEREADLRQALSDYQLLDVTFLRVVLSPDQNIFTKEEAAEYLRCSTDQLDRLMGKGKLPKAKEGHPKFTRKMLDNVIAEMMTDLDEESKAG